MSELLDELRKVQRLGGDTYSSAEVIGLVGRAADEIERLYEAKIEDALAQLEHANACSAEIERLRAALKPLFEFCLHHLDLESKPMRDAHDALEPSAHRR